MWHGMDVRPEMEQLWANVHEASRRAIRKAQKNGVVVRQADRVEDLRTFFDLHLRVRKYKYHLLAQPYAFLENIWKRFVTTGNGACCFRDQGEVIGGICSHWKIRHYKFNASGGRRVSRMSSQRFLWHGIQYAKAQGLSYLDFGLSVRIKRLCVARSMLRKLISFLARAAPAAEGNCAPAVKLPAADGCQFPDEIRISDGCIILHESSVHAPDRPCGSIALVIEAALFRPGKMAD
jgi:hypothetical protein